MATYSKITLTGGTVNGRLIKVAATATAGTTIHTGPAAGIIDELWLYAVNSSASTVKLTIEFGGVSAPDDLIEFTVPAEDGLYLVVAGLLIKGNATALVVRAFAATANVVMIGGYVNRITA